MIFRQDRQDSYKHNTRTFRIFWNKPQIRLSLPSPSNRHHTTGRICCNPMSDNKNTPVGRGTGSNPVNRFTALEILPDREYLEFDEDARVANDRPKTRYFEDTSRSIVSENDSPDIPFRYSINPYRGCLHGCSYCYARPTHEYLGLTAGLDFETTIFVKKDAARLFAEWLNQPNYKPQQVMMSGVTDCYQPIEQSLCITRSILQVAREASQPVSIITKNRLITRDIDILSDMATKQLCHAALSINSLDQSLTRILEPRCSAPASRLAAVRQLADAGVPVHVVVAPVIPGLNDHEMPSVLEQVSAAGATSASYILLRLPFGVKDIFTDWLRNRQPGKEEVVLSRLKATRNGTLNNSEFGSRMRGSGQIAEQISSLFKVAARKHNLQQRPSPLRQDLFIPPASADGQLRLF